MRCFKCSHTWVQERPPAEEYAADETPKEEVTEEAVDTLADDLEEDIVEEAESVDLDDFQPRAIDRSTGKPVTPEKKFNLEIIAWIVLALIFIGAGSSLYFKDQVMEMWPISARLYTPLGLGPEIPGAHMELRNVQSERRKEGDTTVLIIEGGIANVSRDVRDVPLFRGALIDDKGEELHHWTFSIRQRSLLPGEEVPFKTKVRNLPKGATGVSITYLPRETEEEAGAAAAKKKAGELAETKKEKTKTPPADKAEEKSAEKKSKAKAAVKAKAEETEAAEEATEEEAEETEAAEKETEAEETKDAEEETEAEETKDAEEETEGKAEEIEAAKEATEGKAEESEAPEEATKGKAKEI